MWILILNNRGGLKSRARANAYLKASKTNQTEDNLDFDLYIFIPRIPLTKEKKTEIKTQNLQFSNIYVNI